MANIMITQRCNLSCPYCFANEFTNTNTEDMTIDNFKKALDFIKTDPLERVGIIGGEPTLHPDFARMLEIIINDDSIKRAIIYTNGVFINRYIKHLTNNKFTLLINCNPPAAIGYDTYNRLIANLKQMINEYYMKNKITLGFNMYLPFPEYRFIIDILKMFDFDHLRTSIVVPNDRSANVFEYFGRIKPRVKELFGILSENNIFPFFDCNALMPCMMTDEEKMAIKDFMKKAQIRENKDYAICKPIVDILPNLEAIRCFGLSEFEKVRIADFHKIKDLKNYFMNSFDSYAFNVSTAKKCNDCYKRKTMRCSGGCLIFKMNKINDLKSLARQETQAINIS